MVTGVVRGIRWLCRAVGTALAVAGTGLLLMEWQATHAYRKLSTDLGPRVPIVEERAAENTANLAQPDWEALLGINSDVCGWICVEGTDISLPVMSSASVPEGHYLTHDLWGNPSRAGVPFLDSRCDPEGSHCLIYGHHLATGGQFSALQKTYVQDVFDTVGPCLWFTKGKEVTTYEPLCATVVDEWFAPIQRFSFADDNELRDWLSTVLTHARATSADAHARIAGATRAMTLVTCASDLSGQPWRTLVVFVA